MSKFKVGDKVVRHTFCVDYLMQGKSYCVVTEVDGKCIAVEGNDNGCEWDEDYFDLYQEPAEKTFNPKPGDIIVTEGQGAWICADRSDKRFSMYQDYDFFGVRGSQFQAWVSDGKAYIDSIAEDVAHIYGPYNVKAIIPAFSGCTKDAKTSSQEGKDLDFKIKALELENQMLRMLLRREGVEV